jgi:hypothetical protein
MVAIFQLVQEGEIENKDFQELMFRLLLNSVYVGKETIKIVLKYKKDESSTIELPFDPDNIPEVEGSSKRIWSDCLKTQGKLYRKREIWYNRRGRSE